MIELMMNHPYIDDLKAVSVERYIDARKQSFPNLDEDFSALKNYQTMIVMTMAYPKKLETWLGKGYGLVSRYSYGMDYHLVFKTVFEALKSNLDQQGIKHQAYADISPIDERFAAYLAGLGFLGKNQFLIHPKHGTYHYLGVMLVDQAVETMPYAYDRCGACTACIDACPTGALDDGFDKRICSSFVTQMKEPLTKEDIAPLKTMVFGCDICQQVCPKNKATALIERTVFNADENSQLDLIALLKMSNKAITRKYRNYAFAFRGGLVLKRNAMALLYNQNVFKALPLMRDVYKQYQHVSWFSETAKKLIEEMEQKQ